MFPPVYLYDYCTATLASSAKIASLGSYRRGTGAYAAPLQKHIASSAIAKLGNSPLLGAVVATKECAIFFKAVPHNPDATCRAGWRESMDGALEAVEGVGLPAFRHLKCLVIIISASFAPGHTHHSY
jgi:hypothetical protein